MLIQIGLDTTATMVDIFEALPLGAELITHVQNSLTPNIDMPIINGAFILTVTNSGYPNHRIASLRRSYSAVSTYEGVYCAYETGESRWTGWTQIATATPPVWYALPFAEGITGTAQYCKDQFGFVHLRGKVTGITSLNSVFATLPVGFRPELYTTIAATQSAGATMGGTCRAEIHSGTGAMIVSVTSSLDTLPNWLELTTTFYSG